VKQLLILFSILSFTAYSQQRTFELSNNIENDLKSLLPEGSMEFEIMDKVRQSPRQIELTHRVQLAISENYDWFLEFASKMEPGQPLPYHNNLGLTEMEYTEFQNLINDIDLVSSGVIQYEISYSENEIILVPNDTINNERVVINLNDNIVEFNNQRLNFNDTVKITDSQNGFKSEWFGYQWLYEGGNDFDMNELKNLSSLEIVQYKFTIGFLKRTGKVYVQIKGREMANGVKTVDYEFPLVEK